MRHEWVIQDKCDMDFLLGSEGRTGEHYFDMLTEGDFLEACAGKSVIYTLDEVVEKLVLPFCFLEGLKE